jgi:hypothetical protein
MGRINLFHHILFYQFPAIFHCLVVICFHKGIIRKVACESTAFVNNERYAVIRMARRLNDLAVYANTFQELSAFPIFNKRIRKWRVSGKSVSIKTKPEPASSR